MDANFNVAFLGIKDLPHWDFYNKQTISHIKYNGAIQEQFYRDNLDSLDLFKAVTYGKSFGPAKQSIDSHILSLGDSI